MGSIHTHYRPNRKLVGSTNMQLWRGSVVLLSFVVLISHCRPCSSLIEPVSWGLVGGGLGLAGMYAGYEYLKCQFAECCNAQWIKPNLTGLRTTLNHRLHGQHLVQQTVMKAVSSHIRSANPAKALVLSFHGWTGGGKNFVSQMIADHLFVRGMDSKFVHLFVATVHFPHKERVAEYKDNLSQWIQGNVSLCERSLFIFDEMDKMPPGLIDSIKPFLDFHQHINRQNFRRGIFIFLSNTGGSDITRLTLSTWKESKERESITMKDMESLIIQGAFNEEGGFQRSDIIEKHLIDFYIPFLPLELKHVKLCIREELRSRGIAETKQLVDQVADELAYYPDRVYIYSKTGCKHVAQKVALVLEN